MKNWRGKINHKANIIILLKLVIDAKHFKTINNTWKIIFGIGYRQFMLSNLFDNDYFMILFF